MGRQLRRHLIAVDAFGLPREEFLFVVLVVWDVAGARWFGYPTFWVNRLQPKGRLRRLPFKARLERGGQVGRRRPDLGVSRG